MAHQLNEWCKPNVPIWKHGDDESKDLKQFHNKHVLIDEVELEKSCLCVDVLTEYIHKQIKQLTEKQNGCCLKIGPLIRLGSSREGTKIGHADEFDVVLPFNFKEGIITQIIESPKDSLPLGMAKIQLFGRGNLEENFTGIDQNGHVCVNAEFIHMTYFQKLVDKAISSAKDMKLETLVDLLDRKQKLRFRKMINNKRGCNLKLIGRVTDSPAVTLEIDVTDLDRSGRQLQVHVDIVPGFELKDSSVRRKFLVPKQKHGFRDSNLTWRISYSHFEVEIFQPIKMPKGFPRKRAKTLMSSYMVFKGLKRDAIRREPASHFCSFKTYYLKHAFFYVLYFIHEYGLQIDSVSRGLTLLVYFVRRALDNGCLPQFFTETFAVSMYFPGELQQNRPKSNLLEGKDKKTLQQVRLAMNDALERYDLTACWMKPYIKPYEERLHRFYDTVVV